MLSGIRLSTAVATLALVVVAIGSVGPWVDTFIGWAGGLRGDGRITLGAAAVGAIALALAQGRTWGRVVALLAAAVALATAGYDFVHIRHEVVHASLFGHRIADIGWGPIAALIGAAVAIAAVVADSAPPRRWGMTALACGGAVGALIAGGLQHPNRATARTEATPAVVTPPTTPPAGQPATTSPSTATATSSSPPGTPLPAIPTSLGPPIAGKDPQVRPDVIVYSGDGSGLFAGLEPPGRQPNFGRLAWTTWTGAEAVAAGGDWTNNCSPDCASGVRTAFPVTLTASAPNSLGGYDVFTRLRLDFPNGLPPGISAQSVTWSLNYSPTGGFSWSSTTTPPTEAIQPPASPTSFAPGDHNPNDPNASICESTVEVGPHSDCTVAHHVAGDFAQGVWSAPGSDTVTEGASTITFNCTTIGTDHTQNAQPGVYTCVSTTDSQDWFTFEFT